MPRSPSPLRRHRRTDQVGGAYSWCRYPSLEPVVSDLEFPVAVLSALQVDVEWVIAHDLQPAMNAGTLPFGGLARFLWVDTASCISHVSAGPAPALTHTTHIPCIVSPLAESFLGAGHAHDQGERPTLCIIRTVIVSIVLEFLHEEGRSHRGGEYVRHRALHDERECCPNPTYGPAAL